MYGREELAVYRILAQSADEYLYKSEADKVMDGYERRIQELEVENNSLKAGIEVLNDDCRIAKENEVMYHKAYLNELDENARLKTQVPVWHTFSEKKPQLRQLILIKYEHKQEYPDKQMDAILWCPMREEELKLDMSTYKEWCEFPTTEES